MPRISLIPLLPLLMVMCACQQQCERNQPGCNELANKPEYALLQAMELRLKDRPHDSSYLIFPNARGGELTVLAFPLANAGSGYVVLLANAQISPRDKAIPDEDFLVTPEILASVKAEANLSPEVESYILEMARRSTP